MMNDEQKAILRELMPFIVRRLKRGESLESALKNAPDDARDYCLENMDTIIDRVWHEANGLEAP